MADLLAKEVERPRQRLPQRADAQAAEHQRGELTAAFTGDQHLGARRAFRIRQQAVLLDDQGASQRHHHQHAENATCKRQQQDLRVIEISRAVWEEEDQRGHGKNHAAGHRFARRANRLDDVVLEDRRAAEFFQDRDRQHRDRDRRADGEAGTKAQVHR